MHGYWNFGRTGFGMGYNSPWIYFVIQAVIWIVIAFVAYKIIQKLISNKKIENDPILEKLKMKYVEGEITEEEYIKKRDLLKK